MKNPTQPFIINKKGIIRFKENKIVTYLLDKSGINLNTLYALGFEAEDMAQFAQLIGYSVGGFSELEWVSDEDYLRVTEYLEKYELNNDGE